MWIHDLLFIFYEKQPKQENISRPIHIKHIYYLITELVLGYYLGFNHSLQAGLTPRIGSGLWQ